MSDKLTVWTAAKEVSTAVGTMVNTYKTLRTVKKQECRRRNYGIRTSAALSFAEVRCPL